MFLLTQELVFPPQNLANEEGVLAIGGDLSSERLILAYENGIFPWYNEGEPIIWYCPRERMVLFPIDLRISKSMKQFIRKSELTVTFNRNFKEVISNCKAVYRPDQGGTWITDEMEKSYNILHKKGIAKSVEVWREEKLVGGLYGIDLGHVFCGESMFSLESNASKFAFIYLVKKLKKENYRLIDCQVYNNHLASLGAIEIPRDDFLKYLKK